MMNTRSGAFRAPVLYRSAVRAICRLGGAAAMLTGVLAQPAAARQTPSQLDSVAIHENRIQTTFSAQSRLVQVMTAADIRKLPVKSVNELLGYLSGVDIRQRGPWGAQADIGIDGSGFDQVLVLVNGVKMSDPQTGHHAMNIPVPLAAVDHIEVLHGAAARVYGVNALAGAVNIVTRIPESAVAGAQLYGGSSLARDTSTGETYYGYGVQAHGALTTGKLAQLLAVSRDAGNGYRYNTAFRGDRIYYQNSLKLDARNTITATGAYLRNEFGAGLFYAAPSDAEATETTQTAIGSVAWDVHPGTRLRLMPRLSYRYNKDDYIYTRKKPEAYHNVHETNVATAELQGSYQLRSGTVGAGFEYRHEQIGSTNLGRNERSNLGAFTEYRHRFGTRATLNGGIYLNSNSDWGVQVYPGLDGALYFAKHWKAFANLSSGQRLPTYTDLYYKGPTNIGNPGLQPEFATYANGGLRYSRPYFSAQASYFLRRTSDFIDWVRSGTAPWQPQNFGLVHTWGVNAALDLDLAGLVRTGLRELDLHFGYSQLQESLDEGEAGSTKYTSSLLRHQFIARLSAGRGIFSAGMNARYCERVSGGAYTLLDGRVAAQLGTVRCYLEGTNLLDREYVEAGAVPMPGRWISAGAVLSLK